MTAASQPVRRALISVSDKTGVIALGRFLAGLGIEVLSTGGTAKALAEAGVAVKEVSAHTGFPEIMDGRVKTLHPLVHGGILGRRDDPEHVQAMTWHAIGVIDLVVVNLYPFEATVAAGADFPTCVENIDIGGPALIRSAAKNHDFVTVLTDPADYGAVIEEMQRLGGATSRELRRHLAAEAFARTAAYDAAIARWFQSQQGNGLPQRLVLAGALKQRLRYGENPHQSAAFYVGGEVRPGVASATQLQGKELSYNNINDTDAAYELVAELGPPAVAIIKHANPCGVALGADLGEAWAKALAADPISAYGGIVAVNRPLDGPTAAEIGKLFLEVVIAPEVTAEARAVLGAKKNLRVLEAGALPSPLAGGLLVRSVAGGFLVQGRDADTAGIAVSEVVTERQPSEAEMADLRFALTVVKHVKSNAIVLAKNGVTVGIGAGQMSRVDSARIAVAKAAEMAAAAGEPGTRAQGSVIASDAFFPFADGLLVAADAGATAAIHPGGSVRDQEVIAAANERGMAMVVTGLRHFRH